MVLSKSGICINFLPEDRDVLVSQKDESVLDVAVRANINIDHTCGGNGTCGTCRVLVVRGGELLSDRNEIEQEMADDRGFALNERLACQIAPVQGLSVLIPKSAKV